MIGKCLLVGELLLVLISGFTLQACFEEHTYQPAYAPVPYSANGPYGVYSDGDYDQDRHWHDSDWWVDNNRDWSQQHHPDWVANRHHDNDRGHDNDRDRDNYRRRDNDRGHDNDGGHHDRDSH